MNYTELQSHIAGFLNRQDLTAVIPTFIEMVESSLNRKLRLRSMLGRATASLDTDFTTLPADFLEAKNVQLNTNPVTSLQFVTMEHADHLKTGDSGQPKYYTIVGDTIEVVPPPDSPYTVELVYYKKIPPLASNSTNWLLANHPDVYLYGALMQAAPYLKNDDRLVVWGTLYVASLDDLNMASDKAEFSGGSLVARVKN
jgi:hypothetical protein